MKRVLTSLLCILLFAVLANGQTITYKGSTETSYYGVKDVKEDIVMYIDGSGPTRTVQIVGYSIEFIKNISMKGDLTVDDKGNVIDAGKIAIKGAPGKVKKVVGKISGTSVDLTFYGSALQGAVTFNVRYKGKAQ